jgi:KaiC/GvpD/RAD55 family RecA-like ATPase
MSALGVDESMPILKANKLSTGIPDLDIILEGGYFNPGNILMEGPGGIEKSAFIYHFASAAGPKENSYIICGNTSPADIMKKASSIGIDLKKENVRFIDCYSPTLGKSDLPSTEKVRMVPGPGALNDISLMLNEAIAESSGKRMRVIFDTLSTFVIYNPKDSIKKFLSVVQGRLKSAGATTIYLIDEGVHDKQLLSLLEQGMDEKYVITDSGSKTTLTLPDVDMPVPFRVGPTGIVLL